MGQPPEVSHSEAAGPAMRGGVTLGADFEILNSILCLIPAKWLNTLPQKN